jgi:hypothetical protein
VNTPRGVALLARRATILVKHLVDEVRDHTELRLGPLRVMLCRRQRSPDRPPDNPPMNAELRSHTSCRYRNRAPDGVARTNPLWLSSPQKAPRSIRVTLGCETGVGQNWPALLGQNSVLPQIPVLSFRYVAWRTRAVGRSRHGRTWFVSTS